MTGAPSERVCEVAYKPTLQEACAWYNWSFTRRYAQLKGEVYEGVPGKYVFKLPGDCVKVVEVKGLDGRMVREPEMCADGLLLPQGEGDCVVLAYHCDLLGDMSVLDEARVSLFTAGVVCLLASKVAMPLTSNKQLADAMRQEAGDYFYKAILQDKQQDWSNARSPQAMLRERMRNR